MEVDFLSLNGYELALILVLAGSLFDFLDGFFARLLKVKSEFGKELDSLTDFVSFGRVHHSPPESRRPSSVSLQTSQSGLIGLANQGSAHPCARQLFTVRELTRWPVLSKSGNLPPG